KTRAALGGFPRFAGSTAAAERAAGFLGRGESASPKKRPPAVNGYVIELARAVENELERLPHNLRHRVAASIDGLERDPRPRGARKLKGTEASYRIRVGQYRVIYTVDDDSRIVHVIRARHRKDAYQ